MAPGADATAADRARWASCSDAALAAECEVDRYRASGPGGQHRNKTESAVRYRHRATGLAAIGEESRSQAENRERALRRVRAVLVLSMRLPVAPEAGPSAHLARVLAAGTAPLGEKTRQTGGYLMAMAELLDLLAACGGEVAATAGRLGVTTGATSKFLLHDERVARLANQIRAEHGLRPLR
ncbi:MAG: peptide chain release factor-like protein [Kofleriaceae bacterium]|nr:peptide chain release factor-like protein [Kofleriaceae bacterium]MBP6836668.1 peptide chain release factor-like protein [Kofleriaceae bacterium]MBP9205902.1 peptide chain release factor-like protein [Kofleriaceae bacterium]